MLMTYKAEVVRGWPYDGSLDLVEPIKAGVTLQNGDWVVKQADGTIDKVPASGTITNVAVGLVIQGNGDSPTTTVNGITVGNSAQNANGPSESVTTGLNTVATNGRAVVLWGNFIADIQNTGALSITPGKPFTFKSGAIAEATSSDPVVGFVIGVAGNTGTTAFNTSRLRVKVA